MRDRCIICNKLGPWIFYAVLKYRTGKVLQLDVKHRKICDSCYDSGLPTNITVQITEVRTVNAERRAAGIAAVQERESEYFDA